MNSTLLLANAAALAVLLGFHFAPQGAAPESVAQRMPHYLQVQKAPQLAVLNDQGGISRKTVSEPGQALPADAGERLVF